ncbi:MAG: phosphohydrolase [Desulfobacterales bacterium]|nr:phosphohydrolase [Desulfobacterales bacterium]
MKCPGQDTQYWNENAIFESPCPECGHTLEFFKDDATRRCPGCRKKIVNPKMDFGCASYCKFAEQCLGTLPEEFVAQREDLFKDRVAVEMKRHYGSDFKRIGQAGRVARYAEALGKKEKGNLAIILCAAYLNGMDSPEEPGQARALMEGLGAGEELTQAVCQVLDQVRDRTQTEDINTRVVKDAAMLAHMQTCGGKLQLDGPDLEEKINRIYQTDSGKELARETLLGKS